MVIEIILPIAIPNSRYKGHSHTESPSYVCPTNALEGFKVVYQIQQLSEKEYYF